MVRLYQLRRAHGADMTNVFAEVWQDARRRSVATRARLLVHLFVDFVLCWPAAWRGQHRGASTRGSFMTTPLLLHIRFALHLDDASGSGLVTRRPPLVIRHRIERCESRRRSSSW